MFLRRELFCELSETKIKMIGEVLFDEWLVGWLELGGGRAKEEEALLLSRWLLRV